MIHKMILDPDADGSQWLYRGMIVMNQDHPNLLPYACYDCDRNNFLIGATISKAGAKKMIDKYIADKKENSLTQPPSEGK